MVFYFFIFHLDIFILFSYKFYKLTDVTRNLRLIKKSQQRLLGYVTQTFCPIAPYLTRKFIVTLKELPLGSSLLCRFYDYSHICFVTKYIIYSACSPHPLSFPSCEALYQRSKRALLGARSVKLQLLLLYEHFLPLS